MRFRQQKWRGIEVDLAPSKDEEIQNAKFKMQN
jgi:hypothetical protein